MSTHEAVMGEAARSALVAVQVASDAARMLESATAKLETAARAVDPASRAGRSLDTLQISLARTRNTLQEAVRCAPLTTWQFITEQSRHVGAHEICRSAASAPSREPAEIAEVLA